MSSALTFILAAVSSDLNSLEISEWSNDSDRFIVYWKPVTLADKQKIAKYAKGGDQETTVYTIIFKALDSNGDNLFTLEDKVSLLNSVPSATLERIALRILDVTGGHNLEK